MQDSAMAAENSAVAEVLQRLFQTPPAEFVAERNNVVKALKTDGDKELAATIAAVRRPGMSDWLLNVAAVEHPDDVAELVEAATEVIDSQEAAMEGRDAGDLRIRLKLLRVCAATVTTLASGIADRLKQSGAGSSSTDITTRLTEIAANRGALALLERGLLGAEDPGSADPFAAVGGEVAPRAKKAEPAAKAKPAPAPKAEKPAGPTAAERTERRAAVTAAQKALAAAEAGAHAAAHAVTKQETVLAKAEARVTEAETQLEALREAVAAAIDALESARAGNDDAAADVETAQAALAAAETAVDE